MIEQRTSDGQVQHKLVELGVSAGDLTAGQKAVGINKHQPVKEFGTIAAGHDSQSRRSAGCDHIGAVADF